MNNSPIPTQKNYLALFEKEITSFFDYVEDVLKNYYSINLKLGIVPNELVYFKNYKSCYAKTASVSHVHFLYELYATVRTSLPTVLDNDEFLNGKIILQYGKGTQHEESCKEYKILLGDIYKMTKELSERAKNQIKTAKSTTDSCRKEWFLLHLIRSMYYVVCQRNKMYMDSLPQLEKTVDVLETLLSPPTKLSKYVDPNAKKAPDLSMMSNMIKGMMTSMNMDPSFLENINMEQLGKSMQNIMEAPQAKKAVGELLEVVTSTLDPSGKTPKVDVDRAFGMIGKSFEKKGDGPTDFNTFFSNTMTDVAAQMNTTQDKVPLSAQDKLDLIDNMDLSTSNVVEPILNNTTVEPILNNTIVEPILNNTIVEPITTTNTIVESPTITTTNTVIEQHNLML